MMVAGGTGRDNVHVVVRVRPPAARRTEDDHVYDDAWDIDASRGALALRSGPTRSHDYLFDSVVTDSDNERIYADSGRDLVVAAMEGYDAVIFAYGQTASGKTYTLVRPACRPVAARASGRTLTRRYAVWLACEPWHHRTGR